MQRDIFFFSPTRDDLPEEPSREIVLAIAATLKAAGYDLRVAQERSFLFDKITEGIQAKGITHYTNSIPLLEAVLPDNTARDDLVDLLRYMVRNIQPSDEFLLIDPYLFPDNPDSDYIGYLSQVFGKAIGKITRLEVVTRPDRNQSVEKAFLSMIGTIKPGLAHRIKYTTAFHDRFWIADKTRGLFVGTSLNGIGKRYSIADYLREEDVSEIYARFTAVP